MAIDFDSPPDEIYHQFLRLINLWNTTRDPAVPANHPNNANAALAIAQTYNDIFGEDTVPADYDETMLVSDIFHFVANLDLLGQNPVRAPADYDEYVNVYGVDGVMETSEEPPADEAETDTEQEAAGRRKKGKSNKALIKALRKDIVHHKGEHRPTDYLREAITKLSGKGLVQPINRKPDAFSWEGGMYGGSIIQPINQKFLPFF